MRWFQPLIDWVKCNTYGACRGNPIPSYTFYIIYSEGNLVADIVVKIQETTNLVAEARAIREAL